MSNYKFLENFSSLVCYSNDNQRAIAFGDTRFIDEYKRQYPILKNKKDCEIIKLIYDEKNNNFFSTMHVIVESGKILFLKFCLKDQLYLINKHFSKENQKQILVKKIGDMDAYKAINIIKNYYGEIATPEFINMILICPSVLKELGIIENNYTVIIQNNDNEEEISFTEISNNITPDLFYKPHDKNEILKQLEIKKDNKTEYRSDNPKLNYAFDSNIKLLKLLNELSINLNDKLLLEQLYTNISNISNITFNDDTNLDWMIISSYFLLNENKRLNLPNNYTDYLKEFNFKCFSICDNSISIDYEKIVRYIRNSFAHSTYEVIDDEYVRIYGYNEENNTFDYNIVVNKLMVFKIIEDIEFLGNLNNHFPIVGSDFDKDFIFEPDGIKNEEELIKFLNSRKIVDVKKYNFKDNFDCSWFKYSNKVLENSCGFDYYVGGLTDYSYLENDLNIKLEEYPISEEDIEYILEEINKIGIKFYEYSFYNKNQIIANIYRIRKLGLNVLNNEFLKIMQTKNKVDNSLIDTLNSSPIEIYNLQNYIKVLVISYLNNMLLYSYNENINVDSSQLEFSNVMNVDKELLKQGKIKNIEQLQNRKNNILKEKENLIKNIRDKQRQLSNPNFMEKAPLEVIENCRKKLIELEIKLSNWDDEEDKKQILNIDYEIEEIKELLLSIDSQEFNINKYILEHLRNSFAHGNISFPNNLDIYNIKNTKILFKDFHPKTRNKTFEGEITLGELISQLSNNKYLQSIYFDNSHFNK